MAKSKRWFSPLESEVREGLRHYFLNGEDLVTLDWQILSLF
jgi:hypothetical protein